MTCLGPWNAAVRFDGAAGTDNTVTPAVPYMVLTVAVIVAESVPDEGAVSRPLLLSVPTPLIDHENVGWLVMAKPNWSSSVPENCWVAPLARVTLPGEAETLVAVWSTVTVVELVTLRLFGPVTVTMKVYERRRKTSRRRFGRYWCR
jgi:hypothetical protein